MSYYSMKDWKFIGFRKSNTKLKKYDSLIKNKQTGKIKIIPFGSSSYSQYKDSTGLGLYSHLDHNDKERRRRYKTRHQVYIKKGYYSAGYFSMRFLW